MNPAFAIIVVIVCIAVWFLASSLYKPIGKYVFKIGKDAIDELTTDDEEELQGKKEVES